MISRCAGPLRSLRAAEQRELLCRRAAPLLTPLRATCATVKPVHERQVNSDRKASIEGWAPAGIRGPARPEHRIRVIRRRTSCPDSETREYHYGHRQRYREPNVTFAEPRRHVSSPVCSSLSWPPKRLRREGRGILKKTNTSPGLDPCVASCPSCSGRPHKTP